MYTIAVDYFENLNKNSDKNYNVVLTCIHADYDGSNKIIPHTTITNEVIPIKDTSGSIIYIDELEHWEPNMDLLKKWLSDKLEEIRIYVNSIRKGYVKTETYDF